MRERETVVTKTTHQLLNDWYLQMRAHDLKSAEACKKRLDMMLDEINDNQDLWMYYTLLEFRFTVMKRELNESKTLLTRVEPFTKEMGTLLTYYYHFFQGMYHWRSGEYKQALEQYWHAENLLEQIPDRLERAEFHYRVANVYYDMGKHILSVQRISKACEIFRQHPDYGIKVADCENILGINYIELRQYEEAEDHLLRALDIAQKNHDLHLVALVRYNLGFLYSSQRMSETAIRHLEEVLDVGYEHYKTAFLLAREYFRLGRHEKALTMVEEGLSACRKINNSRYIHHLHILKAFHTASAMSEMEATVLEGIRFFESNELWHFVQEYAEELAIRYYRLGEYKKASHYYNLAYQAREKYVEQDALN